MTIASQFVNLLKEENVLDAMNLIKTSLSEQARAEVAKVGVEVAKSFNLSEKMDDKEDENDEDDKKKDDDDAKDKGDASSVDNGKGE